MTLLKNGYIVAAVSIPRIVGYPKLPSRYGKRGYKLEPPTFFNGAFHTALGRGRVGGPLLAVEDNAEMNAAFAYPEGW